MFIKGWEISVLMCGRVSPWRSETLTLVIRAANNGFLHERRKVVSA